MHLDLRLKEMPAPGIGAIQLVSAVRKLQSIASRNHANATGDPKSPVYENRKEKMKQRLMERDRGVTFEQATDEDGRERLLLSLYIQYAALPDTSWLPQFDESNARSVLGENGREWNGRLRKQAALLFFTHFDQLPFAGLSQLCARLVEAYESVEHEGQGPDIQWRPHRKILFSTEGDQNVVRAAKKNEALPFLIERFAIPSEGRFVESLRRLFLLNALKVSVLGEEIPALAEIASDSIKEQRASASQLMGAAALQIMVQRVAKEGGRKWSGDWPNWIAKLGCDPRHGRANAEGAKWWGWATDDELRLAQQGITGLTLRFFIEFLRRSLQETDKEPQFALRSRFLLGLYDAGKIQSARLALNWSAYQHLDRQYRDVWTVAHLSATTDETSMICLRCVDDIYVIEGTHSFGLRMFHQDFPIPGFWERPKPTYQDRALRISPGECPVFLRHDQGGNWINRFFEQLRSRFHVEWDDVRI
jgi:hypothetical protein